MYRVEVKLLAVVDLEIGCITYQRFTPRRDSYRKPLDCRLTARGLELEREHEILKAKKAGCLFVRKIAPAATCDLTCFANSGFERFQCPGVKEPAQEPCTPLMVGHSGGFQGACR